ncbi:MAG TPA: methionine--tRNA ligase, partial [Candidatus Thermoplasmatota archaeon]|nr:methionine--tRNA ligase [Candidatus Thermoplasmatota archaeon]
MADRIFVAVAWPYANGPLHLGHIAGSLLPPDIVARYHRMQGRDVLMVSGSDMHGTPITVKAEKEGVSPRELATRYNQEHMEALRQLHIQFDLFTSTLTENHRDVVHDVFLTLHRNGYIYKATMTAPFDPQARRFLPDRYVEGECPHCHFADARGDQCDNCGRTLDPQELLKPRSKLTGATPEYRETEHFFLKLSALEDRLKKWVAEQAPKAQWRPSTVNFTENWLREGLKDRPITRDITWGVSIPLEGYDDKRIYVWFEAVIGYLSAAIEWAKRSGNPDGWASFWKDPATRGYYFLGKDNIPFHTIIWPAMIMAYREGKGEHFNLPYDVPANEFMQFQGAKFSKSRGNLIEVADVVPRFHADAVRYYLTANMPETKDANWAWDEFVAKVNDELVGAYGNYVHRVLTFTRKHYQEVPPAGVLTPRDEMLLKRIAEAHTAATAHLEAVELKKAMKEAFALAMEGNKYWDESAPWKLAKENPERLKTVLHMGLRLARSLAILTAPFLPVSAQNLWNQLGYGGSVHKQKWSEALGDIPTGQALGEPHILFQKLDEKEVLAQFLPQETKPTKETKPVTQQPPTAPAA